MRVRVSRIAVDHVAEVVDLRPIGLLLGYPLPRGLAHVKVGLEGRRQLHGHELIPVDGREEVVLLDLRSAPTAAREALGHVLLRVRVRARVRARARVRVRVGVGVRVRVSVKG